MWQMWSGPCCMWLTLMCVVSLPADANLQKISFNLLNGRWKQKLGNSSVNCELRALHFTTFITDVRRSFTFRLMRNVVCNQGTAIAKSSGALWTGKGTFRLGSMILYVILQYFRAWEHFVAFRACKSAGLQVFGHMQGKGSWLDQFRFTAHHISFHLMTIRIVLTQLRKSLIPWTLLLIAIKYKMNREIILWMFGCDKCCISRALLALVTL